MRGREDRFHQLIGDRGLSPVVPLESSPFERNRGSIRAQVLAALATDPQVHP